MNDFAIVAERQAPAIRTVAESAGVHTIEGLAFPFKLKDSYSTFFSPRTEFEWGLFADVTPTAARAGAVPRFVRPVTYQHGFDRELGLDRIGGWSPVRQDADGVWIRAQLEKAGRWYERIRALLEAGVLGLSGGSAEHSVRIDQKTGEILAWPAYELALTPEPANPLAMLAARAMTTLRIVADRGGAAAALPGLRVIEDPQRANARAIGQLRAMGSRIADEAAAAAVRRLTG